MRKCCAERVFGLRRQRSCVEGLLELLARHTDLEKDDRPTMKGSDPNKFGDRMSDAAKARAAMLEKARAKMAALAETKPERDAERAKIAAERAKREEQRKIEKEARLKREAEERAAAEAARIEAARLAEEERNRAANEEREMLAKLLIDQKAARDARYAARKQRSGKR
jgi:hypothetical protein